MKFKRNCEIDVLLKVKNCLIKDKSYSVAENQLCLANVTVVAENESFGANAETDVVDIGE